MRVTQFPTSPKKEAPPARGNHAPQIVTSYNNKGIDLNSLLSKFEKDDYILAGIIITLILEGCDDYILLAALGYLFIMGILPPKKEN